MEITKDAKRILLTLYKEYLERRKNGISRGEASYFGDSDWIQQLMFKNESVDDITDFCWELHQNGFVDCTPGDDLANNITLTADTIVEMEHRFPDGIRQVVEAIGKLLGASAFFM